LSISGVIKHTNGDVRAILHVECS